MEHAGAEAVSYTIILLVAWAPRVLIVSNYLAPVSFVYSFLYLLYPGGVTQQVAVIHAFVTSLHYSHGLAFFGLTMLCLLVWGD